jgi:hypothetical protein
MTRSQIIVLSGVGVTLALIGLLSFGFVALDHGFFTFKAKKPELVFNTQTGQDRAVHDFFAGFAREEGFSFEDTTPMAPPEDGSSGFALEMDRGDEVIKVLSGTQPNRFFVFVDAKNPDPALKPMAARMLAQLRNAWPDAAEYKGP